MAAPAGWRPDELRGMIPRDWILVAEGHAARDAGTKPGATAPSRAEVADLVAMYG